MGGRDAESRDSGCRPPHGSAMALCPPCLARSPSRVSLQLPCQHSGTAQSHPKSLQPSQVLPGMCLCVWQGTRDCGAPGSLSKTLLSSHPCARCLCDGSVAPGGSPEWHGAAASELSCRTPSFSPKRLRGLTGLSRDVIQATSSCCISPHSAGPAGQETGGLSCLAWLGSPPGCEWGLWKPQKLETKRNVFGARGWRGL